MRKKKNITPEAKVKRTKIVLRILLGMAVIIVCSSLSRRCQSEPTVDMVKATMDQKLDSLLRCGGFENAQVTSVMDYQKITIRIPSPAEDTLFVYKEKVKMQELDDKTFRRLQNEILRLESFIERYNEDEGSATVHYSRRVNYRSSGGQDYTGIQTIDTTLSVSLLKHVIPVNNQH